MGTGPFAVPSCQRLMDAGHEIALVVVRPPVVGAGKKIPLAPVQAWAQRAGQPIFHPQSINATDGLARLRDAGSDLFFVCDYGQILSRECLSIPRLGGINLHGSLLPRHRGAAPVQWTLLSGDQQAGVSVIHMTPGLDAGPVLATRAVDVAPDENAEQLEQRLSAIGSQATIEAVERLSTWDGISPIGLIQDKSLATKAPRLSKSDGQLDFSLPAVELARRVRGYQPWPGAYGELVFSETKRLAVHIRAARGFSPAGESGLRPTGAVWAAAAAELGLSGEQWSAPWNQLLLVQTGDGWLLASQVQPAGKRPMSSAEFLRGHPLTRAAHFAVVRH